MPLLSNKGKIIKEARLEREPVEVEIRRDFPPAQTGAALLTEAERRVARQEREAILKEARQQAEVILEEARQKRAAYVEEARREGMEIGYRQGMEEGTKKALILENEARSSLDEARRVYRELLEEAEPRLIELALVLAEKILQTQVSLVPETVFNIARGVLEEARAGEAYLIYAHPEDIEFLKNAWKELRDCIPDGAGLQIIVDKKVGPGGCRVETDTGYFDATLKGQLVELKKLLQGGEGYAG
ncbi:MAG TPA: hypothetical protein GX711_01180, partial [Clostridia bacterium]|nr:hypothetical protein [Clostridia bacterium]